MKEGDIVYVNELYTALYCCTSNDNAIGSYNYNFKPGDKYLVIQQINRKYQS